LTSGVVGWDEASGASCADHLDLRTTHRHHHLPHPAAFWLVTVAFVILLFGVTLPAPLYVVYQERWGFSAGVLTAVFAIYVIGVLTALLVFGRASDQIGRKAALFAALSVAMASTLLFLFAASVAWLFFARLLSGLAAGLTQGTAAAALAELEPNHDSRRASLVSSTVSTGAAGLGPLLAGFLVQYLGWRLHLVFVVYLIFLVVAMLALARIPEPVPERQRLTLRPQRPFVPEAARAPFIAAVAAAIAVAGLLGLFVSLVPSFLGEELHEGNHAVAGLVVFLLFAVATVSQVALHRLSPRHALLGGFASLLVGLALFLVGLDTPSLPAFIAGTVFAGTGAGLGLMGALATANRTAPPEHRGEVMSGFFLAVYAGLSLPALAVGISAQHYGFFKPTLVCAALLAALVVFAASRVRAIRALA
jgi:MFS family permease